MINKDAEERIKQLERRVENYALLYSALLEGVKVNQTVRKFTDERIDTAIEHQKKILKKYDERIRILETFHQAVIDNQGHYVDIELLAKNITKKS